MIRFFTSTILLTAMLCSPPLVADVAELPHESLPHYEKRILPILQVHCGKCHGTEEQESDVRFDTLSTDFANRVASQTWLEALHAIQAGEMPPEDEPQLSDLDRSTLTRWIEGKRDLAIEKLRATGGRGVMRRLNRVEYQNTMSDLLGLDMDFVGDLPPDSRSPDGFRNNGQSLRLSAIQLELYLDTARRAMEKVIVSGPPPKVFRHRFERSNVGGWRGATEQSNNLERAQKFLVKMVNDYPEQGRFRIRVATRASLRPEKGFPLLETSVGYRPDTEVHFRVAGVQEIVSEDLQQFEFTGRLENFPLPVRGQGKYPGLVIRLRNVYDDGSPIPTKLEDIERDGKKHKAFRPEPHLPNLHIESVEFEAPIYAEWPPAAHHKILFASELRDTNEVAYIREVLTRFMSKAYRRPATRREVEDMFAHFAEIRPHFTSFAAAIRETLAMVLIQPEFLFQLEPATETKQPVNDWELATRLSYFLWSSMPDETLMRWARNGLLRNPHVLRGEVERMLGDERAQQFSIQFVHQWLGLDNVENVAVDREYYPEFREQLKSLSQQETVSFFRELLRTNASTQNLLQSDFTMLNETLARHYGIENVYGNRFRRVEVEKPEIRGGLLGHTSVLLANSNGQDSHPIRRAVWVRDRLLADPPSPPPPDVPELDEANPDFAKLSVREQLELHRNKKSCASCHRNLDPWGISLENFDAVGLWREKVRKKHGEKFEQRPVVAVDSLANGIAIDGAAGLRSHLLQNRKQDFARSFVLRMLTYSLGRSLELTDKGEVDTLTEQFIRDDLRIRTLIHEIVASETFRTK